VTFGPVSYSQVKEVEEEVHAVIALIQGDEPVPEPESVWLGGLGGALLGRVVESAEVRGHSEALVEVEAEDVREGPLTRQILGGGEGDAAIAVVHEGGHEVSQLVHVLRGHALGPRVPGRQRLGRVHLHQIPTARSPAVKILLVTRRFPRRRMEQTWRENQFNLQVSSKHCQNTHKNKAEEFEKFEREFKIRGRKFKNESKRSSEMVGILNLGEITWENRKTVGKQGSCSKEGGN
jgi:hypothetical protein